MPERRLVIAEEFAYGLANVYSDTLRKRIFGLLRSIQEFPGMGSADVRDSLVERYGEGLRKIGVSSFVIVYRLTDTTIEVLSLVYGPTIR